MTTIRTASTGRTIMNIAASFGLMTNAITIAPIKMPGERRHILSVIIIIF